jgi:hypothetical protein
VCKPGTDTIAAKINSQGKPISVAVSLSSLLLFLILAARAVTSPAQGLKQEIDQYFDQVRQGNYPFTPGTLSSASHEEETLNILQSFLIDSSNAVRDKAYELVYAVASGSENNLLRNEGVVMLLRACNDHDPGIRATALDLLTEFHRIDYNLPARDSLRKLIRSKVSPLDRLLKLAGFLHLTDLLPDIQPLAQRGNPFRLRWSALQSLARMGQPAAIRVMMERVERLPVNDDLVYKIFPDLIFTRQREPIAYVVEALQSDHKNCLSADVERELPIPCGYRIMEQLAPVIENFPLKLGESGDIKTNDYPAALDTVRQWFRIHQSYTILNDSY